MAKTAVTLSDLGYTLCALGQPRLEEAERYFQQALASATELGARPVILRCLVGLATLFVAKEPDSPARERAVEILALTLHHPASEQETKDKAQRFLAELAPSLLPGVVTAVRERGRALDLEATAEKLLAEAADGQ